MADDGRAGPGAAADQQAGIVLGDLQQLALLGGGPDRLNDMLPFGQGGNQRQVVVGRGGGVVLRQVVGHRLGVDAAVFNLHRDVVFKVHHPRPEDSGALGDAEGQRLASVGGDGYLNDINL